MAKSDTPFSRSINRPVVIVQLLAKREMYGYEIYRALVALVDEIISGQVTEEVSAEDLEVIATDMKPEHDTQVYATLRSLKRKGLVRVSAKREVEGRQRSYYALTDRGRASQRLLESRLRVEARLIEVILDLPD